MCERKGSRLDPSENSPSDSPMELSLRPIGRSITRISTVINDEFTSTFIDWLICEFTSAFMGGFIAAGFARAPVHFSPQ